MVSPEQEATTYQSVVATVDEADVEALEERLWAVGAMAVSCEKIAGEDHFAEPNVLQSSANGWQRTRVSGLFPRQVLAFEVIKQLPPGRDYKICELAEQRWEETWRRDLQPIEIGERWWVCPSWCETPAGAKEVIILDPGRAFGTGRHETTLLCLQALLRSSISAQSVVIDYGCGSGILGIAAAKLGAQVLATDIDPIALECARENAAQNDVSLALHEDPEVIQTKADIVVANILLNPLITLAPHLVSLLKPGGHIIFAGVLNGQCDDLRRAYAHAIEFQPAVLKAGWALLEGCLRS